MYLLPAKPVWPGCWILNSLSIITVIIILNTKVFFKLNLKERKETCLTALCLFHLHVYLLIFLSLQTTYYLPPPTCLFLLSPFPSSLGDFSSFCRLLSALNGMMVEALEWLSLQEDANITPPPYSFLSLKLSDILSSNLAEVDFYVSLLRGQYNKINSSDVYWLLFKKRKTMINLKTKCKAKQSFCPVKCNQYHSPHPCLYQNRFELLYKSKVGNDIMNAN